MEFLFRHFESENIHGSFREKKMTLFNLSISGTLPQPAGMFPEPDGTYSKSFFYLSTTFWNFPRTRWDVPTTRWNFSEIVFGLSHNLLECSQKVVEEFHKSSFSLSEGFKKGVLYIRKQNNQQ